jgi:hypothetical protein
MMRCKQSCEQNIINRASTDRLAVFPVLVGLLPHTLTQVSRLQSGGRGGGGCAVAVQQGVQQWMPGNGRAPPRNHRRRQGASSTRMRATHREDVAIHFMQPWEGFWEWGIAGLLDSAWVPVLHVGGGCACSHTPCLDGMLSWVRRPHAAAGRGGWTIDVA